MAEISKQEIEHISQLARIKLDEDEVEKYENDLTVILDYVKDMEYAPTVDTQEISQISDLKNISRKDFIQPSLSQEKVLQNAPARKDNFIKVKKVFE